MCASATSSTRARPAGVRRTMTLRRSPASALRSTSPRSARRSMRFVIAPGRHHRAAHEHAGGQLVGRPAAPQRGEHVVHPVLQAEAGEVLGEAAVDEAGQARDPADHADRRRVEVGPHRRPLLDDAVDGVLRTGVHVPTVAGSIDVKNLNTKIMNVKRPWTAPHHRARADRLGYDLRDDDRAAPAGPPAARRRGACRCPPG